VPTAKHYHVLEAPSAVSTQASAATCYELLFYKTQGKCFLEALQAWQMFS
jgi:hypothetical protein